MKHMGKKARWNLYNDAACCSEQILEPAPHKTTAVQPLTSHLINHPSQMNKICWPLLEKYRTTHK